MHFETVRSRSSKVIDFGTNRKRLYNFLLVVNSNLGPILPHLRDIASFLLSKYGPTPIPLDFWGVPVGLDRRRFGADGSQDLKLISREIIFVVFQITVLQRHRRTDGRTDNYYRGITA